MLSPLYPFTCLPGSAALFDLLAKSLKRAYR
jgi:hypothetical protein